MANDVIFIRCKNCGDVTALAKYYPTLTRYGYNTEEWVTKHLWCIKGVPMDFGGNVPFELLDEQDFSRLMALDSHENCVEI